MTDRLPALRRWNAALAAGLLAISLAACAPAPRGTGDMGIVIGRATGQITVVDNSARRPVTTVDGLGDLSHASAVYSRDERYAYVAGRDGGLSKIDLLGGKVVRRIQQAGNSIGVAISEDGHLVATQNYNPGGVKVFDAETLDLLADIPAIGANGRPSKVVGLADAPGQRFVFSLFDAGEIWLADLSDPRRPQVTRFPEIGRQPYDGLVTPDGRFYIAGLFADDGLALLDLWHPEQGVRRILDGYRKGDAALPVYKMPHLRGWAEAGDEILVPAIGQHEVLVIDRLNWTEKARIPVAGQPVFVIARPDGRQVWVNFALPDNGKVQVIDLPTHSVVATLQPGKAILHMEFTPRGEAVWLSARDDDKVVVLDPASFKELAEFPVASPSGIFFTARAHKIGL